MLSPRPPSPHTPKFIVLGIGNTLMSDDGVGIHVVNELQRIQACSAALNANVQILDGGTLGYLLIDRISDADGLVIVDAANLGAAAGTVRLLEGMEIERYLDENPSSSVHEVGLIDLLQMMSLNDSQPRLRAMVGIQPATIDWGTEMSPAVAASVSAAGELVASILHRWLGRVEPCRD